MCVYKIDFYYKKIKSQLAPSILVVVKYYEDISKRIAKYLVRKVRINYKKNHTHPLSF